MKNTMIWVLGVLMACLMPLAVHAQNAQNPQEWQSTSTMKSSGSAYTPQVTAVGVTDVSSMATTTESYSPTKAPSGLRKNSSNDPWGTNQQDDNADEAFPIGDAVLPLLLMALAFGGVTYIRRRKAA